MSNTDWFWMTMKTVYILTVFIFIAGMIILAQLWG